MMGRSELRFILLEAWEKARKEGDSKTAVDGVVLDCQVDAIKEHFDNIPIEVGSLEEALAQVLSDWSAKRVAPYVRAWLENNPELNPTRREKTR